MRMRLLAAFVLTVSVQEAQSQPPNPSAPIQCGKPEQESAAIQTHADQQQHPSEDPQLVAFKHQQSDPTAQEAATVKRQEEPELTAERRDWILGGLAAFVGLLQAGLILGQILLAK